jgi:hypothetical protein
MFRKCLVVEEVVDEQCWMCKLCVQILLFIYVLSPSNCIIQL